MEVMPIRAVLVASAVSAALSAPAFGRSDEEAVRATSAAWETAYNARDIGAVTETCADGAVSMAPGYPASEGKDAIRADLEAVFAEFDPEHSIDRKELLIEGDLAVERATYRDVLTPVAGGEDIVDEGQHIVVFRRGEAGWKVLWEIWNADAAAE